VTDIGGLEFLNPNPNHEATVMLKQLSKNDVPVGTDVWSVDRENTLEITQSQVPSRKLTPVACAQLGRLVCRNAAWVNFGNQARANSSERRSDPAA
jgi:hypothetical protein